MRRQVIVEGTCDRAQGRSNIIRASDPFLGRFLVVGSASIDGLCAGCSVARFILFNVEDQGIDHFVGQVQAGEMTGERCLLYVAMTRAKKMVKISAYGAVSDFLG